MDSFTFSPFPNRQKLFLDFVLVFPFMRPLQIVSFRSSMMRVSCSLVSFSFPSCCSFGQRLYCCCTCLILTAGGILFTFERFSLYLSQKNDITAEQLLHYGCM